MTTIPINKVADFFIVRLSGITRDKLRHLQRERSLITLTLASRPGDFIRSSRYSEVQGPFRNQDNTYNITYIFDINEITNLQWVIVRSMTLCSTHDEYDVDINSTVVLDGNETQIRHDPITILKCEETGPIARRHRRKR